MVDITLSLILLPDIYEPNIPSPALMTAAEVEQSSVAPNTLLTTTSVALPCDSSVVPYLRRGLKVAIRFWRPNGP